MERKLTNSSILLVDDDIQFLEATEYMLKYENYDVITAKNGEEAIKKYSESSPDIVLMDLKMPVMNGYDAFFKIKKQHPDAKIVFTSAYAINNEEFAKAKKSGLYGLLTKPFDLNELNSLVESKN
ncbi:Response regulator receiver protein [Nitrosopumilus adriaticus]|uniref:Response regulator receiver protein n=1 Tax=Nitrosopumilus adriaticus TaxID=1580092 RepID=A0A0D5C552_9ARCH|nr:Response regulator receiver protein [Nitrosopumilus adriaticus]